jgi:hypothetical protein
MSDSCTFGGQEIKLTTKVLILQESQAIKPKVVLFEVKPDNAGRGNGTYPILSNKQTSVAYIRVLA